MNDRSKDGPLSGRRIALLETREAERLAQMLRERGAEIVSIPAVAIVDAAAPAPVASWLDRFIAAPPDYLVLLTGEGLTRLHGLAQNGGIGADLVAALDRTVTVIRGPKPARALRALGLTPQLRAEQATTEGVIALLSGLDLRGRRIGVQLYPDAPSRLADFLRAAGALPDPVTPYAYEAAAPDQALAGLIDKIAAGGIDAIAFTSASQAKRLFEVARQRGGTDRLKAGLRLTAIAAVGPVAASELQQHGASPTIVPAGRYFMKPLVTAIATALAGTNSGPGNRGNDVPEPEPV
ncbi:MAG: uroporphyrinogen-III synthase [Alphaproteobacteria bacterium]